MPYEEIIKNEGERVGERKEESENRRGNKGKGGGKGRRQERRRRGRRREDGGKPGKAGGKHCSLAKAALTKHCMLNGLAKRNVSYHTFGGTKFMILVSTKLGPFEAEGRSLFLTFLPRLSVVVL